MSSAAFYCYIVVMAKFYVTNSIPYLNSSPHIGFALETIQADVIARWRRQKGDEVFFLSGTDEYGIKVSRSAEAAGKTPQEFVDGLSLEFQNLKPALNLSYDNFIRTTDRKNHWPVAQEIWNRLAGAGDLYKKSYDGLYCVGHEAFVTRKDLIDGKCNVHKTEPEPVKEENWFFKLSKYGKEIEAKISSGELKIIPETRRNEILSFIKEGLEDVSFSRPIKWGIPVPGDELQVMYVWADALTNYISGYGPSTGSGQGGIEKWKEHPADVHIIGKDISRFHALIWPAMLISAELPLPKKIFVHGFITANGEKMSKSLGNVISPFDLVERYGSDAVRYYLLREIPAGEDGDFSEEKFKERYNADLANGIGNLTARVAALGEKLGDIKIDERHFFSANNLFSVEDQDKIMENLEFNKYLENVWKEIRELDKNINDSKPWEKSGDELIKNIQEYGAKIIYIADLLEPFLPTTSEEIKKQFCVSGGVLKIKKGASLFARLS